MNKFTQKAKASTATCTIMENRTKISTEELIAKYPDGVTITGFDFLTGDNGKYPVCIFKENDNECFFGGSQLTEICTGWMEDYVTTADCSKDLYEAGGVKVTLEKAKTKTGHNFIKVTVVE